MAENGCTWCEDDCPISGQESWQMMMDRVPYYNTAYGRNAKMYIRGYRKGVSHFGAWSYGIYLEPYPALDRDWSVYE